MAPAKKLAVPANLTLLLLPARWPELNPVEAVWQFLRQNWLINRIYASYADIADHCCHAWQRLIESPSTPCPSDDAPGPMGSNQ
ncbi:hypothetical protein AEGHOMDF_4260 [Methylobacterium soli]|nr:hypothetical protein AEGHOMDF_4260 [Methylobacterium soli]